MSQEIVRPTVVNQLQDLPPLNDNNEGLAEVITLYPYLEDTDAINATISREFAYLERREYKRRREFLEAVKHLGYPITTTELTLQTDDSETASEKAWSNIAHYKFSDGSSLPGAAFILKEFRGFDGDNNDIHHTDESGDIHIVTEIDEDANAWASDDADEQAFREYIKELNNRPIMQLELAAIIQEAYEFEPESVSDSEVQPAEVIIMTNDIVASEEVIREIRALIEEAETKSKIRNSRFSLLSLLGIVE